MKNKNILIISGSYKNNGNTATLIDWFCQSINNKNINLEIVNAPHLKFKVFGCTSCRKCQSAKEYACTIPDEASQLIKKIAAADVIVFATPLYFFAMSAPIKAILDRMFSLYKWNNKNDTFTTPLKGKTLALIASAYEAVGLIDLEKPFKLTADYTGMKFKALLIPNAGVSGNLQINKKVREKTIHFAKILSR